MIYIKNKYSSIIKFSYIMIIIGVVGSLYGPLILIAFSKKNHEEVKELAINNSLIIGLLTTILVSLLIGFSREFLDLWLGKGFGKYSNWFILKLIDIPFYASAGVLALVYRAWNKVRIPAVLTIAIGAVNVLVINVICVFSNGRFVYIEYMLIFSAICTFIQAYLLGVFMFRSIYNEIDVKVFLLKIPFKFCLLFMVILGCSKLILYYFSINKWYELFGSFCFVGIVGLVFTYFFLISKKLKKNLISLFV